MFVQLLENFIYFIFIEEKFMKTLNLKTMTKSSKSINIFDHF